MSDQSCGCSSASAQTCACEGSTKIPKWIIGSKSTPAGLIPRVSTELHFHDTLGSWKARWGIGRMSYAINPGLYCVGDPDENANVFVTANYKMTFDRLRRELFGINAWILVLDTKGINVWCAAGKGTFGTDELVHRIEAAKLGINVAHRTLILPQLGASGVKAHEVQKQSGFRVVYGPVRASDIKAFLQNGMSATKQMRQVGFTVKDRIVLTPIELVHWLKPSLIIFGVLFVLNAAGFGHYGLTDLYAYLGAVFIGCVLAPVLLPWLPGRAFSFKGAVIGFIWAAGVNFINGWPEAPHFGWLKAAAFLLILPAISAYGSLNFTGSSTFTSLSGVDKEMKIALPIMIISVILGVILLLANDILLI